MLNKFFSRFSKMKTFDLIKIPLVVGFIFTFASILLYGRAGYFGNLIGSFLISFAFFSWGFIGLPMIIRKEMPWLITIRGWWAVVEGVAFLIIFWGGAIVFFVSLLSGR